MQVRIRMADPLLDLPDDLAQKLIDEGKAVKISPLVTEIPPGHAVECATGRIFRAVSEQPSAD